MSFIFRGLYGRVRGGFSGLEIGGTLGLGLGLGLGFGLWLLLLR